MRNQGWSAAIYIAFFMGWRLMWEAICILIRRQLQNRPEAMQNQDGVEAGNVAISMTFLGGWRLMWEATCSLIKRQLQNHPEPMRNRGR